MNRAVTSGVNSGAPWEYSGSTTCSAVQEIPTYNRRGKAQNHLWARKFNKSYIETEEKLINAIDYVNNNRKKHELGESHALNHLIKDMLIDYKDVVY